jgi:hypothetical protein
MQNLAWGGFSNEHFGHFMLCSGAADLHFSAEGCWSGQLRKGNVDRLIADFQRSFPHLKGDARAKEIPKHAFFCVDPRGAFPCVLLFREQGEEGRHGSWEQRQERSGREAIGEKAASPPGTEPQGRCLIAIRHPREGGDDEMSPAVFPPKTIWLPDLTH